MNEIAIAGLLIACAVASANWRAGMFLTVITAFLQDPLRKLVSGQPPYFILFAGIVFGAALLGAISAKVPLSPRVVIDWQRYIARPFNFFVLIVILQAANSLVRFGTPMVTILGLISYLMPFVALALTHAYAATTGSEGIRRLLVTYLIVFGFALTTVYLEANGWTLPIFGEVGDGIKITGFATILTAHSGTIRASEIAAWHAATFSCVVILLMTHKKINVARILIALAIVALVVAVGVLTGRRKFVVMIALFACSYMFMLALFWAHARAIAIPVAILGVLVYLAFLVGADLDVVQGKEAASSTNLEYQLYVQRTSGVFSEVNERFMELGLAPVMWAYNWFGIFGGGVGIGTQGVQHMTKVSEHVGAAEGGLGKIMLELGLPGLIAVGALAIAFARHIWRLLDNVGRVSAPHLRLACGLAAILVANFGSFSVATQAFGDVFVLIFLGLCLGFLMAIPRVMNADFETQQRSLYLAERRRGGTLLTPARLTR